MAIRLRVSLPELLVLFVVGLVICGLMPWSDLWPLAYGAVVLGLLGIGTKGRVMRMVLICAAAWCAVSFGLALPDAFPLRTKMSRMEFKEEPLSEALHKIARQRKGYPSWRFLIHDEEAAAAKISCEIPEGCTLREALEIVARESGCEYEWSWISNCGNAGRPVLSEYRFQRAGTSPVDRSEYAVWVGRDDVFFVNDEG